MEHDRGLYRVYGKFSNPLPVAARVATLLEKHDDFPLVRASSSRGWAFIAWRRPDLLMATAPAGNAWRFYRVGGSSSPTSVLATGEGLTSIGLVGRPTRLGQIPPPAAMQLLTAAGLDYVDLIEDLTTT